MTHNQQNAVALLVAEPESDIARIEFRQAIIREFADIHAHVIKSFLMVDKNSMVNGIRHAMSLCVVHQANSLIVEEPKTLSLPLKELFYVIKTMAELGINLIFASTGSRMDTPALLGMGHLLSGSFICDQELRSSKIKKSLKELKQKGIRLGGKRFGAQSHEAKIIQQILKLHHDGLSLQKICDLLLVNNIKTALNKKWHPTTIKRIIERNGNKYPKLQHN